jgi:hypothetical protein
MKKLFVVAIAALSLGYVSTATANAMQSNNTEISALQSDKVKISVDELPQAVKDTLAQDYKEWQIGEIYKVSGTSEYFSIELKKGTETKTVNLDKDGKEAKIDA